MRVVAYKDGKPWAADSVRTAGAPAQLQLVADSSTILADGNDLSFITARIVDKKGTTVPTAATNITFEVTGPGELVATDNGNPADMTAFSSNRRAAFNGLALAIVRGKKGAKSTIIVKAKAQGLPPAEITIAPL